MNDNKHSWSLKDNYTKNEVDYAFHSVLKNICKCMHLHIFSYVFAPQKFFRVNEKSLEKICKCICIHLHIFLRAEYMSILIKYTLASAVTQYLAGLSQIFLTDPNPSVKLLENMNLGVKMMSHLNNHQFIRGILRACAESAYNPNLENC